MDIYVANLSPETNEEDLKTLFSEFGEVVSARIMKDRETGMSRGFGFVEMSDKFHAMDAIDNLDCTFFQGQIISAKLAKAKAGGQGGGGNRGGFNRGGGGGFNRGGGSGGGFNRENRPMRPSGNRPLRPRNNNNNSSNNSTNNNNDDDRFNRW